MSPVLRLALKVVVFFVGLAITAFGYVLLIKPGLGAAPWDIYHLGMSGRVPIPLAIIVQGTGLLIILLNIALGIRPTLGMVLNMLTVGPMMQFYVGVVPQPTTLLMRWGMLAIGVLLAGAGTAFYVSADLGSGPRDGMMIGLTRILNRPLGLVKNGIDVIVSLTGFWLGGPLGIGTLVVAATLGWSMQLGMAIVERVAAYAPFSGLLRPVRLRRAEA